MGKPRIDLTGQRFGMLVAVKPVEEQDKKTNVLWVCQCDCGRLDVVSVYRLRQGKKTDCGCVGKAQREAEKEAKRKARDEEKVRLKAEKEARLETERKARKREQALKRKAKKILSANERVKKDEVQLWEEKMDEYKKWGLTGTLCWNCIRSAAPASLQCIWDKSRGQQLPEGAEYKGYLNSNGAGYGVVVTSCPEFLPLYERENAELLERERAKVKQKVAQDYYEKVNVGVKHARG